MLFFNVKILFIFLTNLWYDMSNLFTAYALLFNYRVNICF